MKKTKDWVSIISPKVLLIGDNSTLQWSDEIIEHVMFLDYYFDTKPYDLGERSRYTEAEFTFEHINKLTAGWCEPQSLYATNLSLDIHHRAPKGKRLLIPESYAIEGVERIRKILKENPSIEYVFAMGMQVNYYLQKLGFCTANDKFIYDAQPRNIGKENKPPYYQPVNAKIYTSICGRFFDIEGFNSKLIPILPAKDYPLTEQNMDRYGSLYIDVQTFFKNKYKKIE